MFCRGNAVSCFLMSGLLGDMQSHALGRLAVIRVIVAKRILFMFKRRWWFLVLAHCYGTGNGSFVKKWYKLIGIFVLRFVFVESHYTLDRCILRCQIWVKVIFFLFIPYNYMSERMSKKLSNLLMLWACICDSVCFQKSKKGLGCGSLTQISIYLK